MLELVDRDELTDRGAKLPEVGVEVTVGVAVQQVGDVLHAAATPDVLEVDRGDRALVAREAEVRLLRIAVEQGLEASPGQRAAEGVAARRVLAIEHVLDRVRATLARIRDRVRFGGRRRDALDDHRRYELAIELHSHDLAVAAPQPLDAVDLPSAARLHGLADPVAHGAILAGPHARVPARSMRYVVMKGGDVGDHD